MIRSATTGWSTERKRTVRKVGSSLSVSAITSVLSLAVLGALTFSDAVPAGAANVIATIAGIGPSYTLNRRWVWRRTGRSSIRREIGPFWTMCLLALVASTLTVAVAGGWANANGFGDAQRTAVVLAVNVATFAGLWILQFLVLDRVLFRQPPSESASHRTSTIAVPATGDLASTTKAAALELTE